MLRMEVNMGAQVVELMKVILEMEWRRVNDRRSILNRTNRRKQRRQGPLILFLSVPARTAHPDSPHSLPGALNDMVGVDLVEAGAFVPLPFRVLALVGLGIL